VAAVHTLDAARLYRLALEHAAPGTRLHAVADEGVPFRDLAAAISRGLDVPVRAIDPAEVPGHFSYMSTIVPLDNPTSNALTRAWLGWEPTHVDLLADLADGHYFADAA
jgi:nucleoside-diphosphate-sugar epimerase